MTSKRSAGPKVSTQKNTNGSTGFMDGHHEHHHHYPGAPDPRVAVQASIKATNAGVVLGRPIYQWDPADLGVHDSITVQDEKTLTPYLSRDHDTDLRGHLKDLEAPSAGSRLILVLGTSCTGKTRTLYEAVKKVLPKWRLVAPGTDSDLARVLLDGTPAHTVVWLDELQDQLTKTSHGVTAANAIRLLLESAEVGPILFAGTVWPTNRDALRARPDPEQSSDGVGVIPALLETAVVVELPEAFRDADLAAARNSEDARLRKAFATATEISHPEQGRKIIQVLAGGTQLVQRLYPTERIRPAGMFNDGAKAVLLAASDLRRVGMPNPLPGWALEAAAPGYLDPPNARPPQEWLTAALAEVTESAASDDRVTGNRTLDIHSQGVPALTPHWTGNPYGKPTLSYELHDYLYQDHLDRHRYRPTRQALWEGLTSRAGEIDVDTLRQLSVSAEARGLLSLAIQLQRVLEEAGASFWDSEKVPRLLAALGDEQSVDELRVRADDGNISARSSLAKLLASRGDDQAVQELGARAKSGDGQAGQALVAYWSNRGGERALTELRSLADAGGNVEALRALARLLHARDYREALNELRARAKLGDAEALRLQTSLLAHRADDEALSELRRLTSEGRRQAADELSETLADLDQDDCLEELRNLASDGGWRAQLSLFRFLAKRGDEVAMNELRLLAREGNTTHRYWLDRLLALKADDQAMNELRARAKDGDLDAHRELARMVDDVPGLDFHQARIRYLDELAQKAVAGATEALDELTSIAEGGPYRGEAEARRDWVWALGLGAPGFSAYGLNRLRGHADHGDRFAKNSLARLLAAMAIDGDADALAELRSRAEGDRWETRNQHVQVLVQYQDVESLQALTHEGSTIAAYGLLLVYRQQDPNRMVCELDFEAKPRIAAPQADTKSSDHPGRSRETSHQVH